MTDVTINRLLPLIERSHSLTHRHTLADSYTFAAIQLQLICNDSVINRDRRESAYGIVL